MRRSKRSIYIRFRDFPKDESRVFFKRLLELACNANVQVQEDKQVNVDVEITGPYNSDSDAIKTPILKRVSRGIIAKASYGAHISLRNLSVGLSPNPKAKYNIWYTGENQRPPYGNWDGYLSFETKLMKERNFYLPLWWLTSTDLMGEMDKSYWGSPTPTIEKLMQSRTLEKPKKKFVCAFVGKLYRSRLHAIEYLREIGKVDVFGESVHRKVESPADIARDYKFTLCFENDLYPGYVTEKAIEAYLAGTIPLYDGIDSESYFNSTAMLNLQDYSTMQNWLDQISKLHDNEEVYSKVYERPFLNRAPDLDLLVTAVREMVGVSA